MQAIIDAFSALFAKIAEVLQWFFDLAKDVFDAAWDFFMDGVCWVLEEFLELANQAISSIEFEGVTSQLSAFGSIPAAVLEVLSALGMGTALAIVASAIGIRLVLQLIPFTRLGS